MASKWWVEKTMYRVVVEVDGKEEVHEATFHDEHSPWPEVSATCSCGFSVSPRRRGALASLHEHFSNIGATDVKPIEITTERI